MDRQVRECRMVVVWWEIVQYEALSCLPLAPVPLLIPHRVPRKAGDPNRVDPVGRLVRKNDEMEDYQWMRYRVLVNRCNVGAGGPVEHCLRMTQVFRVFHVIRGTRV